MPRKPEGKRQRPVRSVKTAKSPKRSKKAKPVKARASSSGTKVKKAAPSSGNRAGGSWPILASSVTVTVDTSVYSTEAIYGAAYTFMDRAYVHLAKGVDRSIEVNLTGRTPLGEEGLRNLGGEFLNELLNQLIRINLDESGRKVREYIVAKAHFFQDQGGHEVKRLIDSAMQGAFDEDPLDIAVPWEEKFGDRGTGKC